MDLMGIGWWNWISGLPVLFLFDFLQKKWSQKFVSHFVIARGISYTDATAQIDQIAQNTYFEMLRQQPTQMP